MPISLRRERRRAFLRFLLFAFLIAAGLLGLIRAFRWASRNGGWRSAARGLYRNWKAGRQRAILEPIVAEDAERAEAPLPIYADGLPPGWVDWSWATHDIAALASGAPGHKAITMTPHGYEGVYLHRETAMRTTGYGALGFAVTRDAVLSGALVVCLADAGGQFGRKAPVDRRYVQWTSPDDAPIKATPTGPDWVRIRIPLTDLIEGSPLTGSISGVVFQSANGDTDHPIGIAGVALLPDTALPPAPTEATVRVAVDTRADQHPISPYIYGMAAAPPGYVSDLHLAVNRWGGNNNSRYNWALGNACNAARDWRFANRVSDGTSAMDVPSSAADGFIAANRKAGADTLLTIPTIGWVARNADNNCASTNVPAGGGDPLPGTDGAIAGYDPTENRVVTSVPSTASAANAAPGEIAQDSWVRHLTAAFGPPDRGGVRFFAMDNEPDLWDSTHTDVHPARMSYDDTLSSFVEYAQAVKAADPDALITGPVVSGWTGYFYSALDRGSDNFHTHADRRRHGDEPFLLWFLKALRAQERTTGKRLLDVLDVHYYPQGAGLYGPTADPATRAARLRSTRSLWDPAYPDESWIGEPVMLIPRLKAWIAEGYPGTKIGITEWNFGADQDISGGLATADALGILGREGVYLANFWAFPAKDGPGYLAFKLLRNPDGKGGGFGDISCRAVSDAPGRLSAFAALDHASGALTLLLVNKMPKATITAPITLVGFEPDLSRTRAWRLSSTHPGSLEALSLTLPEGGTGAPALMLPPYSATLIRWTPR